MERGGRFPRFYCRRTLRQPLPAHTCLLQGYTIYLKFYLSGIVTYRTPVALLKDFLDSDRLLTRRWVSAFPPRAMDPIILPSLLSYIVGWNRMFIFDIFSSGGV